MLSILSYLQNKNKMYVYVLRKVLSLNGNTHLITESHKSFNLMNTDISESEFLEEEIDSWLLLVSFIWGVVSLGEDGLDLVLQGLSGLLVGKLVLFRY